MEFTEMEKRLLYQTDGCERYAIINELSMASQYVLFGKLSASTFFTLNAANLRAV